MDSERFLRRLRAVPLPPDRPSDLGRDPLTLRTALALCGLDDVQLWVDFVALTGEAPLTEFRAFLAGAGALSERDLGVLEQAIDEQLMTLQMGRMFPA